MSSKSRIRSNLLRRKLMSKTSKVDNSSRSTNRGGGTTFGGLIFSSNKESKHQVKYLAHEVPVLVCDCIAFIRARGLHEKGLFRKPGKREFVVQLLKEYYKRFP